MNRFKTIIYLSGILFLSAPYISSAEKTPISIEVFCVQNPNNPECVKRREREKAVFDREQQDREEQKEQEKQDRLREEQERLLRDELNARKEAQRALEQARREERRLNKELEDKEKALKDKCDDLDERLYEKGIAKRDMSRDYEDNFYREEQEIQRKKNEISEDEIKLNTVQDKLRRGTNKAKQTLQDEMKRELEGLEQQIKKIETGIDEILMKLNKLKTAEMDLFNKKLDVQNEAYITCYDQAQKQTQKLIEEYQKSSDSGQLQRQSMSKLFEGDEQNTARMFNARFEQALNRCLNTGAGKRMRQMQTRLLQTEQEKINLSRKTFEDRITKLRQEIKQLNTNKRVEVLERYKQQMETALEEFNIAYQKFFDDAQKRKLQVLKKIDTIKQRQARLLSRREQEMNMDARTRQKLEECKKEQYFNLFAANQKRQKAWMEQRQRQQQQILENQQRQVRSIMDSNRSRFSSGNGYTTGGNSSSYGSSTRAGAGAAH